MVGKWLAIRKSIGVGSKFQSTQGEGGFIQGPYETGVWSNLGYIKKKGRQEKEAGRTSSTGSPDFEKPTGLGKNTPGGALKGD